MKFKLTQQKQTLNETYILLKLFWKFFFFISSLNVVLRLISTGYLVKCDGRVDDADGKAKNNKNQ